MQPEQFKDVRVSNKMTQQAYGVALGMPKASAGRSVRAYESGERKIPGILANLVRYVERYGFLNGESLG